MALEINNAQFNQFVQFAEQQMQAGKTKAVARVGDAQVGPLAGRTITAAKGEFVGNIWRSVDTRNANDIARDLFRNAIADMFGGADKIPDSVRDTMKLNDFGNGKPLTARRILEVSNARRLSTSPTGRTLTSTGFTGRSSGEASDVLNANKTAEMTKWPSKSGRTSATRAGAVRTGSAMKS